MDNSKKNRAYFFLRRRIVASTAGVWTLLIAVSLLMNIIQIKQNSHEFAHIQARTAYERDVIYRRWSAGHGGVYVPVTENTQPNPYLNHIPERDLSTPSGILLTLMNPAYMSRQVYELSESALGIRGHITSLNPLRPENSPDPWEAEALKAFEKGQTEVTTIEEMDDKDYIRLMSALPTEEACLKCHASQGYQVGDIRGGISISIPMDPINAIANTQKLPFIIGHIIIWILGLSGIVFAMLSFRQKEIKQMNTNDELHEIYATLRAVFESTGDINIFSLDKNYNYTAFNQRHFEEMKMVYNVEIEQGMNILEQINIPGVRKGAKNSFDKVLAGNSFTEIQPQKDMNIFYEFHWNPIFVENEKVIGITCLVQDITTRIQSEETLRQAASLETLSSVLRNFISDSLGNLLTPIYGYLDLSEGDESLDQTKNNLRLMKKGMIKLLSGLNAYRKYSNPKEESLETIKTVDVSSLLTPLLSEQQLKTYLGEDFPVGSNIKLRFFYDPEQKGTLSLKDLPTVQGDQTAILTALQETLINALESYDSKKRGEVLISAEKKDQDLIINIVDKGRGMSVEEREKSQLPFYKILGIKMSTRFGLGAYVAK